MIDERNTHIAEEDNGRTLEQIISDVEERRFAKLPSEPMTPERLHAMAAARRSAAGRCGCKVLGGIAAVVILALVGTLIAASSLSVDVGADKNQKEEIRTEDGVIIEDGGYGASDNTENIWVAEDWAVVPTAKELYPQLIIPKYIPEGYAFNQLVVEQIDTGNLTCKYTFFNMEEGVLEIDILVQEEMLISLDVDSVSRTIKSGKGIVYIQEDEIKIATIQMDDGIVVNIWSSCSDKELIKIINNLVL